MKQQQNHAGLSNAKNKALLALTRTCIHTTHHWQRNYKAAKGMKPNAAATLSDNNTIKCSLCITHASRRVAGASPKTIVNILESADAHIQLALQSRDALRTEFTKHCHDLLMPVDNRTATSSLNQRVAHWLKGLHTFKNCEANTKRTIASRLALLMDQHRRKNTPAEYKPNPCDAQNALCNAGASLLYTLKKYEAGRKEEVVPICQLEPSASPVEEEKTEEMLVNNQNMPIKHLVQLHLHDTVDYKKSQDLDVTKNLNTFVEDKAAANWFLAFLLYCQVVQERPTDAAQTHQQAYKDLTNGANPKTQAHIADLWDTYAHAAQHNTYFLSMQKTEQTGQVNNKARHSMAYEDKFRPTKARWIHNMKFAGNMRVQPTHDIEDQYKDIQATLNSNHRKLIAHSKSCHKTVEIAQQINATFTATADVSQAFYQISIPQSLQQYTDFAAGDNAMEEDNHTISKASRYRWNVVPHGAAYGPLALRIIMEVLMADTWYIFAAWYADTKALLSRRNKKKKNNQGGADAHLENIDIDLKCPLGHDYQLTHMAILLVNTRAGETLATADLDRLRDEILPNRMNYTRTADHRETQAENTTSNTVNRATTQHTLPSRTHHDSQLIYTDALRHIRLQVYADNVSINAEHEPLAHAMQAALWLAAVANGINLNAKDMETQQTRPVLGIHRSAFTDRNNIREDRDVIRKLRKDMQAKDGHPDNRAHDHQDFSTLNERGQRIQQLVSRLWWLANYTQVPELTELAQHITVALANWNKKLKAMFDLDTFDYRQPKQEASRNVKVRYEQRKNEQMAVVQHCVPAHHTEYQQLTAIYKQIISLVQAIEHTGGLTAHPRSGGLTNVPHKSLHFKECLHRVVAVQANLQRAQAKCNKEDYDLDLDQFTINTKQLASYLFDVTIITSRSFDSQAIAVLTAYSRPAAPKHKKKKDKKKNNDGTLEQKRLGPYQPLRAIAFATVIEINNCADAYMRKLMLTPTHAHKPGHSNNNNNESSQETDISSRAQRLVTLRYSDYNLQVALAILGAIDMANLAARAATCNLLINTDSLHNAIVAPRLMQWLQPCRITDQGYAATVQQEHVDLIHLRARAHNHLITIIPTLNNKPTNWHRDLVDTRIYIAAKIRKAFNAPTHTPANAFLLRNFIKVVVPPSIGTKYVDAHFTANRTQKILRLAREVLDHTRLPDWTQPKQLPSQFETDCTTVRIRYRDIAVIIIPVIHLVALEPNAEGPLPMPEHEIYSSNNPEFITWQQFTQRTRAKPAGVDKKDKIRCKLRYLKTEESHFSDLDTFVHFCTDLPHNYEFYLAPVAVNTAATATREQQEIDPYELAQYAAAIFWHEAVGQLIECNTYDDDMINRANAGLQHAAVMIKTFAMECACNYSLLISGYAPFDNKHAAQPYWTNLTKLIRSTMAVTQAYQAPDSPLLNSLMIIQESWHFWIKYCEIHHPHVTKRLCQQLRKSSEDMDGVTSHADAILGSQSPSDLRPSEDDYLPFSNTQRETVELYLSATRDAARLVKTEQRKLMDGDMRDAPHVLAIQRNLFLLQIRQEPRRKATTVNAAKPEPCHEHEEKKESGSDIDPGSNNTHSEGSPIELLRDSDEEMIGEKQPSTQQSANKRADKRCRSSTTDRQLEVIAVQPPHKRNNQDLAAHKDKIEM